MADLKFPLFIDLTGRRAAVFGGGTVAARRVKTLCLFGAAVCVTAPEICGEIAACGAELQQRGYRESDLEGAYLVLAATDDEALNHEITAAARARGIPANNASDRNDSDFFFPAVAVTEDISVGICGTGKDHGKVARTAAALRQALSGEE